MGGLGYLRSHAGGLDDGREKEAPMVRGAIIGFILAIIIVVFLLVQCSRTIF
jgi:tetrahydromethanopterin S-methyltransferase subunit F